MGRYEIRLSGEGGQGLVLAGAILAEAAGIYEGKHVVYTQSYGPESRGGSCRSDLVSSDEPIDYPLCTQLDLLLALTQKACDKFWPSLKENGLLVVDSTRVTRLPSQAFQLYAVPILQTAKQKLGREVVANMVCLGVVAALSGIVSRDSLNRALLARVPKGTEGINQRALEAGFGLVGDPALTTQLSSLPR